MIAYTITTTWRKQLASCGNKTNSLLRNTPMRITKKQRAKRKRNKYASVVNTTWVWKKCGYQYTVYVFAIVIRRRTKPHNHEQVTNKSIKCAPERPKNMNVLMGGGSCLCKKCECFRYLFARRSKHFPIEFLTVLTHYTNWTFDLLALKF